MHDEGGLVTEAQKAIVRDILRENLAMNEALQQRLAPHLAAARERKTDDLQSLEAKQLGYEQEAEAVRLGLALVLSTQNDRRVRPLPAGLVVPGVDWSFDRERLLWGAAMPSRHCLATDRDPVDAAGALLEAVARPEVWADGLSG